jgi:hypothetical protein
VYTLINCCFTKLQESKPKAEKEEAKEEEKKELTKEEREAVEANVKALEQRMAARRALDQIQRRLEFHRFLKENKQRAINQDIEIVTDGLKASQVEFTDVHQKDDLLNRLAQYAAHGNNKTAPAFLGWVRYQLLTPMERNQMRMQSPPPLEDCLDEKLEKKKKEEEIAV